ncbi:RNA polymerase subunit sigma-24 [Streptomyces antibioticus]|nr:RNA polymerase sigma-70 factor [Streptomyces antibioticus]KUN30143.1 RNA polymerase subunit sigma-24 [Streptomyces antibioticus]
MTSDDSGTAPPSRATSGLDDAVSVFLRHRGRLFGIAYRVLGSVTEAEDVVQEVWLRWQKTDRAVVDNPMAFLSTTATRLAINVAQSARVRRESYIGTWLPEPVDTSADPEVGAERAEAVELALLLVLERLNPTERAAYVLREAFDYGYPEIAEMLRLNPANVRQIVSRARRHLLDDARETVDTAEHRRLLDAFVAAARTGDVASLEALLTPDAVSLSDGNGIRGCARVPVLSAAHVAKLSSRRMLWHDAETEAVTANGLPGALVSREGRPVAFLTVVASKDGIHQVLWVFNPDKIAAFLGSRSRGTAALG